MDLNLFQEMVDRYFAYLTDEYGFSKEDQQFNTKAFGNAYIQMRSDNLVLRISIDKGIVLVNFKPLSRATSSWFDLASLTDFLNPKLGEPAYIFSEEWDQYEDMIENQMQHLSHFLRQYLNKINGVFAIVSPVKHNILPPPLKV